MITASLLVTQAECDSFSSEIAADREDLLRRKANLLSQKDDYAKNAVTVGAELARVTARLSVADTIIAALPEGPEKNKEEANKSKLTWRLKALNNRKEGFGAIAILDIEAKVAEIDARIGILNAILVEIANRKAEIV